MATHEVGSLRHRQDIARELWGMFEHLPAHFGPNTEARFHVTDTDAETHPFLQGLTRITRNNHHTISMENPVNYTTHHLLHNTDGRPTRTWGQVSHPDAYTDLEVWHELAHDAIKHKRPPISDKVRALIHNPGVAADQLEEEGHDALAHLIRHGTLVDTHHGDDANFPDVAFIHGNRPHVLVRSNERPLKRYHFVGEPLR